MRAYAMSSLLPCLLQSFASATAVCVNGRFGTDHISYPRIRSMCLRLVACLNSAVRRTSCSTTPGLEHRCIELLLRSFLTKRYQEIHILTTCCRYATVAVWSPSNHQMTSGPPSPSAFSI